MTTKIPSPADVRAERVDSLRQDIDAMAADLVGKLRSTDAFRAEARAVPLVIEGAEKLMREAGWCCLVEKGGARDNGKTWGLTVSAEPIACPLCYGRGSWHDERRDESGKCSNCNGSGRVR